MSLSYGKDSVACLGAIEQLGLPLDRVITAEVWATDTIQADLPPMIEFKEKVDEYIKEKYGIIVEHSYATTGGGKLSFEKQFYKQIHRKDGSESIYGFPIRKGQWCTSRLKTDVLKRSSKVVIREDVLSHSKEKAIGNRVRWDDNGIPPCSISVVQQQIKSKSPNRNGFSVSPEAQGADINIVQYLGIAADETKRIERHKNKPNIRLPLVKIGWDEEYCMKWCEEKGLLSPIYKEASRGGCWFCHNQRVDQLRLLRSNYPELWKLLLKWDNDSPVSFKANGITVHDYDFRFECEEKGLVPSDRKFRWKMLDELKEKNK